MSILVASAAICPTLALWVVGKESVERELNEPKIYFTCQVMKDNGKCAKDKN